MLFLFALCADTDALYVENVPGNTCWIVYGFNDLTVYPFLVVKRVVSS